MGTVVRGNYMQMVRTIVNSNLIANVIALPSSLLNKEVEVTVSEAVKESAVNRLYGMASNLDYENLDDVRSDRLSKYEIAN